LQNRLADKGRLPLTQVMEIARQAGSALAAAHAAGIVHRDLKPENLFLVPDAAAPGGERVKILDFGIAKIRRAGGTGGTMRTQAGLIMGSPAYMSPEQCKDSADVDLRSDIYSFATIVYEMLAGKTPYAAASGTEMLIQHLTGTPAPLRELVANLPAHVEAAIMRALARARADRFDSMASFVGALRANVGMSAYASSRSSSGDLPAVGEDPAAPAASTSAAPSVTTFSRATGEVGVGASDDVLLEATRNRRWPFFAFGAVALAGLALFLLVRPSHDSAPRPTPGALRPVATDAAVAGRVVPARQERPRDAGLLAQVVVHSRADGGVASPASGRTRAAAQHRPSAAKRGNSEDQWLLVH
jgi:serine/threonine-protein kinase